MTSESAGHRGTIHAPQDAIVDALAAAELYPQWQSGVVATEVHERDEQGRATLVTLQVDTKVKQIRYTARYWYRVESGRMGFDLVEGDLKQITGRYAFAPRADGGTDVTIDITTDVGFYVPGPLRKLIQDQALRTSLRDLKRRVEGG